MPELPEVETTLRGIEPYIINKKINDILVRQSSLRWEVPVKKLKENIVGESFSKIKRRAKYFKLQKSRAIKFYSAAFKCLIRSVI